ncbi:MAG TPA: helix-turn-helix domain-containing protein [Sporichthyaceae bacterium]|jgi:excisionase family DNA binding protein|nr:helix-turn-helix domain-containing protein [Sporichthyaceae bacterium]
MSYSEHFGLPTVPAQRRAARDAFPAALLTVPEAMSALRLSRATIYELIRSGQLVTVKVGRSRRVPVAAIGEYIARLVEQAG